jgi:lipid A 4'-phosphatase
MINERLPHAHQEHEDPDEADTRLIWAVLFFALAAFAKMPGLDLLVSARYYSADKGFIHRNDPLVLALYDWTPLIGRGLVLLAILFALAAPLIARWLQYSGREDLAVRTKGPWRHMATVSVCCALLGPGLVVEGVLKNVMARPRPVQVVQFGGTDGYQGPFVRGDDPAHHRSFVSSHAAAGFALMSLGITCGPVWRRRWFLIGLVAGGVIGMGRIMQGGHFLSDIIFAFYAVWLSNELIAWLDRRRIARHAPPTRRRRAHF